MFTAERESWKSKSANQRGKLLYNWASGQAGTRRPGSHQQVMKTASLNCCHLLNMTVLQKRTLQRHRQSNSLLHLCCRMSVAKSGSLPSAPLRIVKTGANKRLGPYHTASPSLCSAGCLNQRPFGIEPLLGLFGLFCALLQQPSPSGVLSDGEP